MLNAADGLKNEVTILLDRALHAQSLTFFGEDGGGLHGRSTFPVTCRVRCLDVEVETFSDDIAETVVYARLFLEGYQASENGHAITDQNLRIALNQLLDAEHIDREALSWGPLDYQGEDFICLQVDAARLLAW